MQSKYITKESVLNRANEAIGVPITNFDINKRLRKGKGSFGQVIEEGLFDLKVNNKSEPDFKEAGVELKVTPYKKNKNSTYSSKERLVLNIINYDEEYKKSFETSSFWVKNKLMLIMFYEYLENIPIENFFVSHNLLFDFPEEDLLIIKQDWEKIKDKICQGRAEEISESDTMYLAACTKGSNKKELRTQPKSIVKAMQRAYSLKQSYMTYVLRKYVLHQELNQKIIKRVSPLEKYSFEEIIQSKINPFLGKSQKELLAKFGLANNSKSINEILVAKMLGINGRVSQSEEFLKAGIIAKTISIKQNGSIKENMSFPTFKFKEIAKQSWEDSVMKQILEETKFMFIIFQSDENNELILKKIKFWNMPFKDVQIFKKMWLKTKRIIKEGVKIKKKGNIITNNLPKSSENPVGHVRPHAKNAKDTDVLPNGKKLTKQCFWLNNYYMLKQI